MLQSRSPIYWLCSSTLTCLHALTGTKPHRQPLFPIQPSRSPSGGHLISRIIFHTWTITLLMLISTYNFCWPLQGKNINKRLLHLEKPISYLQIRENLCLFCFLPKPYWLPNKEWIYPNSVSGIFSLWNDKEENLRRQTSCLDCLHSWRADLMHLPIHDMDPLQQGKSRALFCLSIE